MTDLSLIQDQDRSSFHQLHEEIHKARISSYIRVSELKFSQQQLFQNDDEKNVINNPANIFENWNDHILSLNDMAIKYDTDLVNGLTITEAKKRNLDKGDNIMKSTYQDKWWMRILNEVNNAFSHMLLISSALGFIAYALNPADFSNISLGVSLILLVIITAAITYQQQSKTIQLLSNFHSFMPSNANVIRGGVKISISPLRLVCGDIVEIKAGDKIPADLRIIISKEMKIDNSSLTGESNSIVRTVECTNKNDPIDSKNLCFYGTVCKEGAGRGLVIRIADKTVLGMIAQITQNSIVPKTPLRKELDRFVVIVATIALVLCVFFFFIAFFTKNYTFLECCVLGIGILVANVPEGLLACITICLALTASSLMKKELLVKNLEAIDSLGSSSCILTDKTGTLTKNKMLVTNIWYDGKARRGDSIEKFGLNAKYDYNIMDPTFINLHQCSILTSDAVFNTQEIIEKYNNLNNAKEKDVRKINWIASDAPVIGYATESALIKFFQPIEDINLTRFKYKTLFYQDTGYTKISFNSLNKYSLAIVEKAQYNSNYTLFIKGAPEIVFGMCSKIAKVGADQPIDASIHQQFQQADEQFGSKGERVIGFAMLVLPDNVYPLGFKFNMSHPDQYNFPINGYTFLGLIAMMDPPKQNVAQSIEKCRSAGVKVVMVTGDQASTSIAIAKQIGLFKTEPESFISSQAINLTRNPQNLVISGDNIKNLLENPQLSKSQKEQTLIEWCKKNVIFVRTTPAHKLLIVKAFQAKGDIVAQTGDGVNDSPAIKQADVGIAMGQMGSDITKQSADIVLLNDDFSAIIDGIEEGRRLFDNLKKTIMYLMTSNSAEIWPILSTTALGLPLPLSSIFMLIICIGTDILPALSLSFETSEIDLMVRQPRTRTEHLVTSKLMLHAYGQQGMIASAAGFFAYFTTMNYYGFQMESLFNLIFQLGISPVNKENPEKVYSYDQNSLYLGNKNLIKNSQEICDPNDLPQQSQIDWQLLSTATWDLRNTLVQCITCPIQLKQVNNYEGQYCWQPLIQFSECQEASISPVSNAYVCYTTESLKYAQSSYFLAVVCVQWSNVFGCKCRKNSFFYSSINIIMIAGILLETCIGIVLMESSFLYEQLGSRPLKWDMFFSNALPFSILILVWEEMRKYLVRRSSLLQQLDFGW